jgi:ABC-type multidrug transport system fused ATPase/permease subunit
VETEKIMMETLKVLAKNRTTIMIAHRLSTVTFADKIVVMDAGKVVESGTHSELMKAHGVYFEMVSLKES